MRLRGEKVGILETKIFLKYQLFLDSISFLCAMVNFHLKVD